MTDKELIAEGRKHVRVMEQAQLTLGMLALAYAPIGDASVKTGVYRRLEEYAEAIGIDVGSLRNYRAVAHAWQGIDHGDVKFSLLKGLTPVADKQGLLDALKEIEPPTKSKRWTVTAAIDYAREHGYWSHSSGERDELDVIGQLRRTRTWLARVELEALDDEQRADLLSVIDETRGDLTTLRERLTGQRVR